MECSESHGGSPARQLPEARVEKHEVLRGDPVPQYYLVSSPHPPRRHKSSPMGVCPGTRRPSPQQTCDGWENATAMSASYQIELESEALEHFLLIYRMLMLLSLRNLPKVILLKRSHMMSFTAPRLVKLLS